MTMSLTATAILCNDGKWYKEPVYRGDDYFICFDDDEPPEIVIKKPKFLTMAVAYDMALSTLKELGIKAKIDYDSYNGGAQRNFGGRNWRQPNFVLAFRFFITIEEPPPPPDEFDKKLDSILAENCCIYHFGRALT